MGSFTADTAACGTPLDEPITAPYTPKKSAQNIVRAAALSTSFVPAANSSKKRCGSRSNVDGTDAMVIL
jgi:hypothetical protein